MDNCEAVRTAIEEGKCMFGTVDTWIIWVCGVCMHVLCMYMWVFVWWECKQVISLVSPYSFLHTEPYRWNEWWCSCDRCDQCQSHHADEHPHSAMGPWAMQASHVAFRCEHMTCMWHIIHTGNSNIVVCTNDTAISRMTSMWHKLFSVSYEQFIMWSACHIARDITCTSQNCSFFGIPMEILPQIRSSAEVYGCMVSEHISPWDMCTAYLHTAVPTSVGI